MSRTIELPDPLFAEIDDYAARAATSPLVVLKQAWSEFARRHAPGSISPPVGERSREELLAARSRFAGIDLIARRSGRPQSNQRGANGKVWPTLSGVGRCPF